MRICLVRLPAPFLIDEWVFPPLGLMSVGTSLRAQGHDVCIYEGLLRDLPVDYPYYGLGPTTPQYADALSVKHRIKISTPAARVIIGGPHATLNPKMCLMDGFDSVVIGDGEIQAAFAFQGIGVFVGEELPLDTYPTIDRTIVDLRRYHYSLNGRPATTIMTGQGCPYRCGFCSKNYQNVRFRSLERVAQEIALTRKTFGYTALAFPEDLFILNRTRAEALFITLRESDTLWRCLIRGDLAVKYGSAFLQAMHQSGCVEVGLGVESGSDTILRTIHKGETTTELKQAIRMAKDAGIRVKAFFILGLPGESLDTLEETRNFLESADLDDVDIKIYQPYPGQPIWNHRELYDIAWNDQQDPRTMFYKGRIGDYHGSLRTSHLTTKEIYDAWVELETRYKKHATLDHRPRPE